MTLTWAKACRVAALLLPAIKGGWLAADRIGFRPLGFSDDIVLLTAVHFHFAGLVLPLVTGAAVREFPGRGRSRVAAGGVIVGVPLVAISLTAAQLHIAPMLEAVATGWLGLAGLVVEGWQATLAARRAGWRARAFAGRWRRFRSRREWVPRGLTAREGIFIRYRGWIFHGCARGTES